MNPAPTPAATVLPFPTPLTEPVVNRKRRGRLPKAVTALADFRLRRQVTAYQRAQAIQQADRLLLEAETYLYGVRQRLATTGLDAGRVSGALFQYVSDAARLIEAVEERRQRERS